MALLLIPLAFFALYALLAAGFLVGVYFVIKKLIRVAKEK